DHAVPGLKRPVTHAETQPGAAADLARPASGVRLAVPGHLRAEEVLAEATLLVREDLRVLRFDGDRIEVRRAPLHAWLLRSTASPRDAAASTPAASIGASSRARRRAGAVFTATPPGRRGPTSTR